MKPGNSRPRSPHPATVAQPFATLRRPHAAKQAQPQLPHDASKALQPAWLGKLPSAVKSSGGPPGGPPPVKGTTGAKPVAAPLTPSEQCIAVLKAQWEHYEGGGSGLGHSQKDKIIYSHSAILQPEELASVIYWWEKEGGTARGPHFYLGTNPLNQQGPHVNLNCRGFAGHLYLTGVTVDANYTRAVTSPGLMNRW